MVSTRNDNNNSKEEHKTLFYYSYTLNMFISPRIMGDLFKKNHAHPLITKCFHHEIHAKYMIKVKDIFLYIQDPYTIIPKL